MQCDIMLLMKRKLFKILGFGVDSFTDDEAVEYILENHGQVVTINPEMIMNALDNSAFAGIINSAELVIPDSAGIELGLRVLGYKVARIPGIEFGHKLLKHCAYDKKTVALVGARPDVIEKTIKVLRAEIPGLNIVYTHDGYSPDDSLIKAELVKIKPDLVLVALGSPKQEFFIADIKKQLPETVLVGVGGSFDVWAGTVERAPEIFRKLRLEWFYRAVKQPERFSRIFPALPLFVFKVLKERLSKHA